MVERCLAKANVASSNLVSRSKQKRTGQRPVLFCLERILDMRTQKGEAFLSFAFERSENVAVPFTGIKLNVGYIN